MKLLKFKFSVVILFAFLALNVTAQQERFVAIEKKLTELAKTTPGLNEKVELSVNGVSIQDFIRGIATANNLNVSVDNNLTLKIVNNFSNVTVSDVLLFLCKKHDLDLTLIGNIISITQYVPPPVVVTVSRYTPKQIKVTYDKTGDLLSFDLNNDSLALFAKELTKISQKNVVFAPDVSGKMVSGFIQNTPFASALQKFAFANDLKVTPTEDNFFLLEKKDVVAGNTKNNNLISGNANAQKPGLTVKSDGGKLLSVEAINMPIADILAGVSSELKMNYFLFTEAKGNTSLSIKNTTYDEFLNYLFNGTDYTFKKDSSIYMIGDRSIEGLRSTKVLTLKYRTIDKVIDAIPAKLKEGIDVKVFKDLNGLIVSGSQPRIDELETFLRSIDRVVPVIAIEIIIVDVRKSHTVSTGIKAGLGDKPVEPGGQVFPGVDVNLGANAINAIIDGINGSGVLNLGKVTPNFYLSLKLMEENGDIDINSTPLIATLNGNEAKMSIGETKYYVENNSNVTTNQSTTITNTQIYKPLTADLAISINPIVSGDEQITMEITVKKSSFTEQSAGPGSPYGTITRDFQSMIRVKNQEMVMLGGLDEVSKTESSKGVPVLSRIPVIKWLFSSRTKAKSKNKLTIFIKATVIY